MEGVGIWAMVVLAFDRGSRQHDMKSLEVNFSSLKMESPREGRCKRERETETKTGWWKHLEKQDQCQTM